MTMRRTLAAAALLAAGLAGSAVASEFDDALVAARKGDYQAQRNVAYMLERGDGAPSDAVEGCAWRFAIIGTQGAKVGDTDVMIDERCGSGTRDAALTRATAIMAATPAPARTVEADIAALTEDDCPGPACQGPAQRFADSYRRAMKGDGEAMRAVAACFATGCLRPGGADAFKACLWATRLAGNSRLAAPADRATAARLCGGLGAIAAASIEPHSAMIDAMRLVSTPASNPPKGSGKITR